MVTPNIKKKRTQIFCRLLQKIPGQEVDSILFLKWGFIATPPDQPADILGILSETEEDTAMTLINKEHARQIQFLLDKHEETITNFATLQIIKLSPAILVSEVLEIYRDIAKGNIMYLYVVDNQDPLWGVADVKEPLWADPSKKMEETMVI